MNRNYLDAYDPEFTAEDMGRPARQELARDAAEGLTVAPPCGCGRCLVCAVRGRR